MQIGFVKRTANGRTFYAYYGKDGRMRTGCFKAGTVSYRARGSGEIYSVRNDAEVISQRPQLQAGCEVTAWTMMANYAGAKITKTEAVAVMPRSSDPDKGFVGDPRIDDGLAVIYPRGMLKMTREYLGSAEDMTDASVESLQKQLWKRHLVVVWMRPLDGFDSHTIALTGYDDEGFFYNDPWTGSGEHMDYPTFKTKWEANGKRALSY